MAKKAPAAKAKRRKSSAKKVVRKAAPKRAKKAVNESPAKSAKKTPAKSAKKTAAKSTKKTAAKSAKTAPPPKRKLLKSPLTKKETAEFREMLLAKRRTLLGDMTGMEAEALRANRQDGAGDLSTMPVHMADVGTDNYEQEFTLGLLESERQLLREIDEAINRLAEGTYGICMGTGQDISKARLRAKPWAKFCIEYARKLEQGLIRRPRHDFGLSDEEEDENLS